MGRVCQADSPGCRNEPQIGRGSLSVSGVCKAWAVRSESPAGIHHRASVRPAHRKHLQSRVSLPSIRRRFLRLSKEHEKVPALGLRPTSDRPLVDEPCGGHLIDDDGWVDAVASAIWIDTRR